MDSTEKDIITPDSAGNPEDHRETLTIKHDLRSREDDKMIRFLEAGGVEPDREYGRFWWIIEMLDYARASKLSKTILLETCAIKWRTTKESVLLTLDRAIEIGLFQCVNDWIFSPRLNREKASLDNDIEEFLATDVSLIRAAAGRRGGLAKAGKILAKSSKRSKASKTDDECISLDNTRNINTKSKDLNTNTHPSASKPSKTQFASYVFLSEIEHSTLIEKFGPEFVQRAIDKLDGWIGQDPTPKRIRNGRNAHHTFKNWVLNAVAEEESKARNTQVRGGAMPTRETNHEKNMRVLREAVEGS